MHSARLCVTGQHFSGREKKPPFAPHHHQSDNLIMYMQLAEATAPSTISWHEAPEATHGLKTMEKQLFRLFPHKCHECSGRRHPNNNNLLGVPWRLAPKSRGFDSSLTNATHVLCSGRRHPTLYTHRDRATRTPTSTSTHTGRDAGGEAEMQADKQSRKQRSNRLTRTSMGKLQESSGHQ